MGYERQTTLEDQCPVKGCDGKLSFLKAWKLKGKGDKYTKIEMFRCSKCNAEVRIPTKGEEA